MQKYLTIMFILSFSLTSTELIAREKGRHVLITKTGTFKLAKANQNSSRTFTTQSDSVYGLEYEWHMWQGLSIGGEFFHYENKYTISRSYKTKTSAYLFNAKYHFNKKGALQPFLGFGSGSSIIPYTGQTLGSLSGSAYQFMAGFTYRFKHVGIYAEYKNLNTKLSETFFFFKTGEVDASGEGLNLGISVLF